MPGSDVTQATFVRLHDAIRAWSHRLASNTAHYNLHLQFALDPPLAVTIDRSFHRPRLAVFKKCSQHEYRHAVHFEYNGHAKILNKLEQYEIIVHRFMQVRAPLMAGRSRRSILKAPGVRFHQHVMKIVTMSQLNTCNLILYASELALSRSAAVLTYCQHGTLLFQGQHALVREELASVHDLMLSFHYAGGCR